MLVVERQVKPMLDLWVRSFVEKLVNSELCCQQLRVFAAELPYLKVLHLMVASAEAQEVPSFFCYRQRNYIEENLVFGVGQYPF